MSSASLKKGLHIGGNILFAIFFVILILIVALLVKGKMDGGVPAVGPYKLYVVLSGSMSGEFETGSIIAVSDIDAAAVAAGDVITFKRPGEESMIITHRVMEVIEENGELSFVTKGDANDTKDADLVPAANLLGKQHYDIPYAGYLADFAKSKKGLLIMIVIPGVMILINEMRNLMKYAVEYDEEQKKKKIAEAAEAEGSA